MTALAEWFAKRRRTTVPDPCDDPSVPRITTVWIDSPDLEVLLALSGQAVAVYVPVRFDGVPIPFGEFFRYARVDAVSPLPHPAPCTRCAEDSRFRIDLIWESGYVSPDGDVACELCIAGRVTGGLEFIDFPPTQAND